MGPVRIVVVDDFEPWRRTIVSILKQDPTLEVIREASDGLEAVRMCVALQPDLVVLDVGLPKLNGLEAARQIREISPATKILFMSANGSTEMMREALRMDAVGYIAKTNASRHLLPAVKAAMANEKFLSFTLLPEIQKDLPEE